MMDSNSLHEDLCRQSAEEKSSERGLGITIACLLIVIGIVRRYHGRGDWVAWFILAVLCLFLAYFWTAPLRPLNSLWHRFGLFLFHVVNPVVMGIVFVSTICPTGVLMRLLGRDPLKLKFDREAETYWQERAPSGSLPQSMKNQF
jgi:hypothetical protein